MVEHPEHTFGLKCRLAPVPRSDKGDGLPDVQAQFFYSSLIPIDDPLSTGSITGSSDSRGPKGQLRPFARGDNNALEKAWLSLASVEDRRHHEEARAGHQETPDASAAGEDKRAMLVQALAVKHWDRHRSGIQQQDMSLPTAEALPITPGLLCCAELVTDVSEELQKSFCALARRFDPFLTTESVAREVTTAISRLRQAASNTTETSQSASRVSTPARPSGGSAAAAFPPPSPQNSKPKGFSGNEVVHSKHPAEAEPVYRARPRSLSLVTNQSSRAQTPAGSFNTRSTAANDGISGRPFVRVENFDEQPPSTPSSLPNVVDGANLSEPQDNGKDQVEVLEELDSEPAKQAEAAKERIYGKESLEVAVGVSRLHMVCLPTLQMKPIYWSPINDVAVVMRATWFYR